MSVQKLKKAPAWFSIMVILWLCWNLAGVLAFVIFVTMGPDALSGVSEAGRQLHEAAPLWIRVTFAVTFCGGALGSLILLMKSNSAGTFLQVSFAGALVLAIHAVFFSDVHDVQGIRSNLVPILSTAIAFYLVVLAEKARMHHWTI
jgi:hypothetical protein